MTLTIVDIATAFSRHEFEKTYPHLAPNVRWEVVGDRDIVGREAVIAACDESASYLAGVRTTFTAFRVSVGVDFVLTDGRAEYADGDDVSRVASCDVYRFDGGELAEITSYTVELSA